jgi:hypothetical protein
MALIDDRDTRAPSANRDSNVKALKKGCAKSTVDSEIARAAVAGMNVRSECPLRHLQANAAAASAARQTTSDDRDTLGLRTKKRV